MGHVDECSSGSTTLEKDIGFVGVHHVGILCKDLDKSLKFYSGVLGMKVCDLQPDKTLPFCGAWLWVGDQMIHLIELILFRDDLYMVANCFSIHPEIVLQVDCWSENSRRFYKHIQEVSSCRVLSQEAIERWKIEQGQNGKVNGEGGL
ncbi:hypothetical protein GOP47_0016434 [Adiantum capillus-veneris]|uniref:Glyoxalase/fosfomycin resistance/dioxygenase domain-containing protein n=1 Tax=Adiantum capillus-veneris TaxID=13818 RepID=A0A9D4UHN6_ADICA|nr:hypothetical protein GOP47_0016434 [Adiantum capillus-veneris]